MQCMLHHDCLLNNVCPTIILIVNYLSTTSLMSVLYWYLRWNIIKVHIFRYILYYINMHKWEDQRDVVFGNLLYEY